MNAHHIPARRAARVSSRRVSVHAQSPARRVHVEHALRIGKATGRSAEDDMVVDQRHERAGERRRRRRCRATRAADEWGAIVVSLTRGDTLFSHNADAMMEPASTMKMYTSAVALDRFGPDFTFKTPVFRDGTVGADGTLNGNLYLKGVGDPSLSSRFWHEEAPMDALAKQVAAAGIKRVHGDVVGDASAFDDKLVPDGWKSSYLGAAYAARVSGLSLNENLVWVAVHPENGKAVVALEPASTTIPLENNVRLVGGSGSSISAARRSDGGITVRGSIGANSGPVKYSLVADNPPLFATGALRAALQKAGITVDGQTRLATAPSGATEVASIASPPLSEIIGEMDRESINLYAELLFRAAAHAATNQPGSAETGLANLREFMAKKVGTSPNFVDVADGSGLSQLDKVTPRSMAQLLGYAHRSEWAPVFHAALPVDGESGTLKRRVEGHAGSRQPARENRHHERHRGARRIRDGEERRGAGVLADLQRRRPLERQGGDGSDRRDDGGVRSAVGTRQGVRASSCRRRSPGHPHLSFLDVDPALAQLVDVVARRHALVGRVHAGRLHRAAHLHQSGDRERVAGRPHHRAHAVRLIEAIDELERARGGRATLRALHDDAQRDEIATFRLRRASGRPSR